MLPDDHLGISLRLDITTARPNSEPEGTTPRRRGSGAARTARVLRTRSKIVCGALLVFGLLTRLATVPLLMDITVAILSTKVPILLGHGTVASRSRN